MCTLTFIPTDNDAGDFILTFNRDENPNRKMLPLQERYINDTPVWMPIDEISGGSCIGISGHDFIICLHNGAEYNHIRKPSYLKSRGELVNTLLGTKNPTSFLLKNNYILPQYENHTLFIFDFKSQLQIHRCIWDGARLSIIGIDIEEFIYSSATLYTPQQKKNRFHFFKKYVHEKMNPDLMMAFHNVKNIPNKEDIFIKRDRVETISTTQIVKKGALISMTYYDYVAKNNREKNILITEKALISK